MGSDSFYLNKIALSTERTHALVEKVVKEHDDDINQRRVELKAISDAITAGFGDRNVGALPGARLVVWADPLQVFKVYVDVHYKYYNIDTITVYVKSITATEIGGALTDELREYKEALINNMQWIDKIYTAVEAKTV